MADLTNKILLVTGGSRGIGRAIALEAAKAGAIVVLTYNQSKEAANQVVEEIKQSGGQAFAVQMHLQDPNSIQKALDEAIANTGRIDILVNNAAELLRQSMLTTSVANLDAIYQSNLRGPFMLAQSVARQMIEKNIKGNIINITTDRDLTMTNELTAYQTMKAALNMLTQLFARHLAPAGIRVNTIAPGMTQTDMHKQYWQDKPSLWKTRADEIPLKRAALPEDIAHAVVFIASDKASYITGSRLCIDGGRTVGLTSENTPRSLMAKL